MKRTFRALGRLVGVAGIGVVAALAQGLFVGPVLRNYHSIGRWMMRRINAVLNLSVDVRGMEHLAPQAMIAANHTSYLDAMVLASVLRGHFIGKREVADWPVLGRMIKQFDPILIRRNRTHNGHAHYKVINALNQGKNIILFPEATTSNGAQVLPFRAGMFRVLFGQAVDRNQTPLTLTRRVMVQPVAIRIASINNQDASHNQSLRDCFAWHEDISLLRHAWTRALRADNMRIEVTVLPPLHPASFSGPEALANVAHARISHIIARNRP